MSKLVWDKVGERLYETGVSKGVLYPQSSGAYPKGVAWNGSYGSERISRRSRAKRYVCR